MSRLFMLKSNNSQLTLYFKKMKKYLLLSIVFSLFLCGCTQKQNEVKNLSGMETIPITDFETYNGRFSEFAEDFTGCTAGSKDLNKDIKVVIARGIHLFPFRTEKLSLVTPMVLRNSGRVGSRRFRGSRFNSCWIGFFLFLKYSFCHIKYTNST